jgi:uncharacterized protein YbjT (DUF2867 family)
MTILLCGSSGFIGQQIMQALSAAGHEVVATRSPRSRQTGASVEVDFNRDTRVDAWLPRLSGIDAVINAVGVLRDTRRRPMRAVHEATPKALFDACAQAGVRRVIQVSALGIEHNPTLYAHTKLAADEHLLQLNAQGQLDGVVLRPSIVFGEGGDSSRLFMTLARSPVLWLPAAVIRARVQPLVVQDLAQAVVQLLGGSSSVRGVLPCVGPQALTLADFIACLRQQQGHHAAWTTTMPSSLTRLSVRIGDHIPAMPWCSETLALLAQDNVAPPHSFEAVLGRAPVPPADFLRTTSCR